MWHRVKTSKTPSGETAPAVGSLEGRPSLVPEFPASDSPGPALSSWDLPTSRAESCLWVLVLCVFGIHAYLLVLVPRASSLHLPVKASLSLPSALSSKP